MKISGGIGGLLHDLDYAKYPEEHCKKTRRLWKSETLTTAYIHAIECHGYGLCTDVEPKERMEIVLYTIDELTGLITAAALMRPSKRCDGFGIKISEKRNSGINGSPLELTATLLPKARSNGGFPWTK